MPEKETLDRAHQDAKDGKSPSTQAGEFVREEMDHIREGKHGARSTKQAIAIGLSKARRAGVDLPAPKSAKTSDKTREQAARDTAKGKKSPGARPSPVRSRTTLAALKREGTQAASHEALSKQAKASANSRTAAERSRSAEKAARTRAHGRWFAPKDRGRLFSDSFEYSPKSRQKFGRMERGLDTDRNILTNR